MIELVYMSQSQYIFTVAELTRLLETARINNIGRGITGMLLYDGIGTFIQAIEGEKEQIDKLYKIIAQDHRHSNIQQLSYCEVFQRSFAGWQMGYKCITDKNVDQMEGYSDFMSEGKNNSAASSPSFGIDLLNHFRQTTC
jgi:hypothetical protein